MQSPIWITIEWCGPESSEYGQGGPYKREIGSKKIRCGSSCIATVIRGAKRGRETDDETRKADLVVSTLMPSIPRKTHQ